MPRPLAFSLLTGTLLIAGCGNSRTPAPSLTRPLTPQRFQTLSYSQLGLSIAVPAGWTVVRPHPPLVVIAASGNAIVSLWRYPRSEPVPSGSALTRARLSLIAAVRARQPGLDLLGWRAISIDHRPAVVLEALERIRGLLRRVRSVHVFSSGEEVVLEEYAPPKLFGSLSQRVFARVRTSLAFTSS